MASTIDNDGAFYPASSRIVLRANSAGNPIFHNQVDGNFENLRIAHNQVVTELAVKSDITHTHGNATSGTHGFMSSSDKAKFDTVEQNANNYSLPTASSSQRGGIKIGSNLSMSSDVMSVNSASSSTAGVVKIDNSTLKINGSGQVYVTDTHSGLTNNPHNVTASQVGLGSVVNDIASLNSQVNTLSSSTTNSINSLQSQINSNQTSISNQSAETDTKLADLDNSVSAHVVPVGAIMPFAGPSIPQKWVLCDGRALSRSSYSQLYGAIGTSYGSGNGSTTFNVPDLRGRVIAGQGTSGRLSGWSLGSTGGQDSVTLTVSQMPSHDHVWFGENDDANSSGGGGGYGGKRSNVGVRNPQNVPYGKPTYTTYTGGNGSHTNIQPTMTMNYIIHSG